MQPQYQEFRLMCKWIRSNYIELYYRFWESVTVSLLGFRSKGGGDGHLAQVTILCKIQSLGTKLYTSLPPDAWIFVSCQC